MVSEQAWSKTPKNQLEAKEEVISNEHFETDGRGERVGI